MTNELFEGRTLDEALSAACAGLGARIGEIHYEVVEEHSAEGVRIAASIDPVAVLGLFLSEAFAAGGLEIRVRLEEADEALTGELSGADTTLLTGNGGQALDALQYLCNRVLDNRLREHLPVHLDCGGFKERRADGLRQRARETADRVARKGRSVTLPWMTPAARREVHVALHDDDRVETESEGSGFLKRVVIRPRRQR